MSSRRSSLLALLLLLVSNAAPTSAHPSHTTVSEAEFNAETGRLEVALRLAPEDLEAVLSLRESRKLVLEREPHKELEKLCAAYLSETFRIEPKIEDGLELVGLELEAREVWLYFELPVSSPATEAVLVVEILMELHAQQLNTVYVRSGESRRAVTFSTVSRSRPLRDLIEPPSAVKIEQ